MPGIANYLRAILTKWDNGSKKSMPNKIDQYSYLNVKLDL